MSWENRAETSTTTTKRFDMDAFIRRNMGDLELSRDVAAIFIDHRKEYIEAIRIKRQYLSNDFYT